MKPEGTAARTTTVYQFDPTWRERPVARAVMGAQDGLDLLVRVLRFRRLLRDR